jgi:hypothetical protein
MRANAALTAVGVAESADNCEKTANMERRSKSSTTKVVQAVAKQQASACVWPSRGFGFSVLASAVASYTNHRCYT